MKKDKNLSINDLKSEQTVSTGKQVEVQIGDLREYKKDDAQDKYVGNIMDMVDSATKRIANESKEFLDKQEEKKLEKELEADISDDEDIYLEDDLDVFNEEEQEQPKKKITYKKEEVKETNMFEKYDEENDDEDEEDINSDSDKQLKEIKSKIKEKLKPVTKAIDLSTFSISKKPVSVSNVLKTQQSKRDVSDWVLIAGERPISIEEFTGLEIEKLNPANSSRNRINTYKDIYSLIYSHIVDANKPATMEEWVKTINFFDNEHLYFNIYKASFNKANFIPYNCPHCNEVFVTDDVSIDDMIKYKDDKAKELVEDLLTKDTTSESNEYPVELIQVSDDYVVGLKEASVYNMIFENAILDEKFTTKYSDLLSVMAFIDGIYVIDYESNELRPIEVKTYPQNIVKNIKSKISTYSRILKTLTSDQLNQFNTLIRAIQDRHDEVSYVLPSTTCPKCGKEIEETPMSAENLLFTRHQLGAIASS